MTTFDRYLLARFTYIFAGFFAASMGLYAVIDGFTNLDEFQQATQGQGVVALFARIGQRYLYQTSWVLDLIGPTLATMSVVTVLALLLRHGEVHPLLAAGVPTYRLSLPFLAGVLGVNGLLVLNQEAIIPRIALFLTARHGEDLSRVQEVDPQYDRTRGLFISGLQLVPGSRTVRNAEFRLWADGLVTEFVSLRAPEAVYYPANSDGPAGWLLTDVSPPFDELSLTATGESHLIAQPDGRDVFVVTDVSFDQLSGRGTSYTLLSTRELIRRVRRPSATAPLHRAQVLHLHARITRPLLNVVGVFLVVPLIVRRESRSLVTSIAVCMIVLASVIGVLELFQYLGRSALVRPELAAWAPFMYGGGLCAWLSPLTRT